jgi:hypothetical protein
VLISLPGLPLRLPQPGVEVGVGVGVRLQLAEEGEVAEEEHHRRKGPVAAAGEVEAEVPQQQAGLEGAGEQQVNATEAAEGLEGPPKDAPAARVAGEVQCETKLGEAVAVAVAVLQEF